VSILERGRLVASGTIAQIAALLRADRPVRMRFAEGCSAAALSALEGLDGITGTRVDPRTLSLTVTGGDAALAEAVRRVVATGSPLVGVEPERQALERAFLELTAGDVQ
jgi:ABC-2 type transport system ATP-binding protein